MNCSVCNHPERPAIDQALVGGATLAAVSKKYNLSTSALDRHKAHLRARSPSGQNPAAAQSPAVWRLLAQPGLGCYLSFLPSSGTLVILRPGAACNPPADSCLGW